MESVVYITFIANDSGKQFDYEDRGEDCCGNSMNKNRDIQLGNREQSDEV